MNKLFYAPGACSIGIHVLLEEIGKPYEAEQVDLRSPAPQRPYPGINPKTNVPPRRRDDGSILTAFPAIAFWLARTNPQAGLLPDDAAGQARAAAGGARLCGVHRAHALLHADEPARQFLPRRGRA